MSKQAVILGRGSNELIQVLDSLTLETFKQSVFSCYNSYTVRETLLSFKPVQESLNGEKAREILVGGNIYALIHLQNSGLLEGARLATRADLERGLECGLDLRGIQVEFGVALAGEEINGVANQTSAEMLVSQLKKRGVSLNRGKLIPLPALTQKQDRYSSHGLTLSLKEDFPVDSLANLGDFGWSCKTLSNGGVYRASLGTYGGWNVHCYRINAPADEGRAVIVKSVGVRK